MKITNPEILKIIADRNRRIVEIAEANPNLTIREIAAMVYCSKHTVKVIFHQNGITRTLGRPRKAVSRG